MHGKIIRHPGDIIHHGALARIRGGDGLIFCRQAVRRVRIKAIQRFDHPLRPPGLFGLVRPFVEVFKQKRPQIRHDFRHGGRLLHHAVMRMLNHIHHQGVDAAAVGVSQGLDTMFGQIFGGKVAGPDGVLHIVVHIGNLVRQANHRALRRMRFAAASVVDDAVFHFPG